MSSNRKSAAPRVLRSRQLILFSLGVTQHTMPTAATSWHYTKSVTTERRAALSEPASFDELVALAKGEICHIRLRIQPGRDPGLTDCLQPVFSFDLPGVGDRLFNGPFGYRAQDGKGHSTACAPMRCSSVP